MFCAYGEFEYSAINQDKFVSREIRVIYRYGSGISFSVSQSLWKIFLSSFETSRHLSVYLQIIRFNLTIRYELYYLTVSDEFR